MVNVNILSWNVEQFGNTRYQERTPYVSYFVSRLNPLPDIFVLIELKTTDVEQAITIAAHLRTAVNNAIADRNVSYEYVLSYQTDIECYCMFYNPQVVRAVTIPFPNVYGNRDEWNSTRFYYRDALEQGTSTFKFRQQYSILTAGNWAAAPSYAMTSITHSSVWDSNTDNMHYFFPLISYPGFEVLFARSSQMARFPAVAFFKLVAGGEVFAIVTWHNNASDERLRRSDVPFRNANLRRLANANYIKNGFTCNIDGVDTLVKKVIITGDFNVDAGEFADIYSAFAWSDGRQYKTLITDKTHLMQEDVIAKAGETFRTTQSLCNYRIDNFICQPDIGLDKFNTKVVELPDTYRFAHMSIKYELAQRATQTMVGRRYTRTYIDYVIRTVKALYPEVDPSDLDDVAWELREILDDGQYTTFPDVRNAMVHHINTHADPLVRQDLIVEINDMITMITKANHALAAVVRNPSNVPTYFASYFVIRPLVSDHLPIVAQVKI